MAIIKTISKYRAKGERKEAYQSASDLMDSLKIPNIVQIFSLRPASMQRVVRKTELAMFVGSEPRSIREQIGVLISFFNRCHY